MRKSAIATVSGNATKTLTVKAGKGQSCYNDKMWCNRYRLVITNPNIVMGNNHFSVSFYDSHNNYCKGIDHLDEKALKGALNCCIMDATCYMNNNSLEDFAYAYGYDIYEDRKEVSRVFNGCRSTYLKLKDLGLSDNDIYDFETKLCDMGY